MSVDPPDDQGPDFLRDMADPAAYEGARGRQRTLVTAVWCTGAAAIFALLAVLAILTGAPLGFALVCIGLAVVLGIAAASVIRTVRH